MNQVTGNELAQMWSFAASPFKKYFNDNNVEVWTVGWDQTSVVKVSLWALGTYF